MSRTVLYEKGIQHLFSSPRGPVAKIIRGKADLIESNARKIIQSKYVSRTGDLEGRLRQVPISDPLLFRIAVGTDAQHRGFNYARALETGQTDTGVELRVGEDKIGFMKPAVQASGFVSRGG